MLEYTQRGYWQTNNNQINELHKTFLELEGDIEDQ
jgi:hypothetical protein